MEDISQQSEQQIYGQLISQGAEAKIYIIDYLGEPTILKQRLFKKYRHPILDEKLSNERILQEVRNMSKTRKLGINTPYVVYTDLKQRRIYMQYVDAIKSKDYLYKIRNETNEVLKQNKIKHLLSEIGHLLAKMHDGNILHGDLTTSNILVKQYEKTDDFSTKQSQYYDCLYFIDFGLSYIKDSIEDKAVDLYVLEKAFLSTHPELEEQYNIILETYAETNSKGKEIIQKLKAVRARGRKKDAFG